MSAIEDEEIGQAIHRLYSGVDKNTEKQTNDKYLVTWDGIDDEENMKNMPTWRKWVITLLMSSTAFYYAMLSSVWSACSDQLTAEFNTNAEENGAGVALYTAGLAFGPLIAAPFSDFYGRRPVYIVALLAFFALQFLTAFGQNIPTLLIGRFLPAYVGAAMMSNSPATVSDIFHPEKLTMPVSIVTLAPFIGPSFGPFYAGMIVAYVNWRWVFYIGIIWTFVMMIGVFIVVPETHEGILLKRKAERIRNLTGCNRYHSTLELRKESLSQALWLNVKRPLIMLFTTPMLAFLCLYTGYVMAVIYLMTTVLPLAYRDVYGFEIQFVGCGFLAICLGLFLGGCCANIWKKEVDRQTLKHDGKFIPEYRLIQMCIGAVMYPVAVFWFAWTIYSSIHWIVPIISTVFFGLATYFMLNSIMVYIVEVFSDTVASAVAANIFTRCLITCAFPLFGDIMMKRLGYHWGMSVIAIIAVLFAPSAFILKHFGERLRTYKN